MHNHELQDYVCPFCRIVKEAQDAHIPPEKSDVVCQTSSATAFLALCRWPNNPAG